MNKIEFRYFLVNIKLDKTNIEKNLNKFDLIINTKIKWKQMKD